MSTPPYLFVLFCVCLCAEAGAQNVASPPPAPTPINPSLILTPPAAPSPRLNNPRVYGARPGNPFLYSIPATGERPMTFTADGLPVGLTLDAFTGRISGRVAKAGEFDVTLHAKKTPAARRSKISRSKSVKRSR